VACYTPNTMPDPKDSVLDKAESLARRILERLGSKLDAKLTTDDQRAFTLRKIGDLTSRIEQLIESSLEDDRGVRRVAPNRFTVLFTYEETSTLSAEYIQAMGNELTPLVSEYINNRRYATRGPVVVEIGRDVFAKETIVKGTFETDSSLSGKASTEQAPGADSRFISLNSVDGRSYRLELKRGGAPVCVGRAAGNAIRIDDPSISRLHCSISLRASGGVIIADVGSANGTYVNDRLLGSDEASPLRPGDLIGVGDFKFTVSEIT
jgi:hypothetical protein